MTTPQIKVPLSLVVVGENPQQRGWLEWDGSKMFISPTPSDIGAVAPTPVIPPDVIEPDPDAPTPNPPLPTPEPNGEQIYTNAGSYTFMVPLGVHRIEYVIVGGGGAGASGARRNRCAGAGGQAGEVVHGYIDVTPGQAFQVIVGNGGGQRCGAYNAGNPGGASSFGTFFANGGQGGQNAGEFAGLSSGGTINFVGANQGTYIHGVSLGGGNVIGGPAQKTYNNDRSVGYYTGNTGSFPHKVGGAGGTNGIGKGGQGGVWSWSGPAGEVAGGYPGTWPGGGGGGGGSDEGDGPGCGANGANGGVYLFWGVGRLSRFPTGVPTFSSAARAGVNCEYEAWYVVVAPPPSVWQHCCVHPSSMIDTPSGKVLMADLKVGDTLRVFDEEHRVYIDAPIESKTTVKKRRALRLVFESGEPLLITEDHPILKETGWEAFNVDMSSAAYAEYNLDIQTFNKRTAFLNSSQKLLGVEEVIYEQPEEYMTVRIHSSKSHCYTANGILVHNGGACH